MDEYLRSRYKKADGDPAQPPKRQAPPRLERTYNQAARPMFPLNPKPARQEPKLDPVAAPASHYATPAHEQSAAKRLPRPKLRFGLIKILAVLLILAGVGGGGGYYYLNYVKAPSPLPKQLVKSVGFPVYYPTKLPGTYKYQPGSVNQSGLLVYKIADGADGVVISEQKKPTTDFNPSGLPNFKSINVSDGTASIGTSSNVLTVIYVTPTTLINMTAVNRITQSDMISIAQNLSAIKQ